MLIYLFLPLGDEESYFLSCRRRTNKLVCRLLSSCGAFKCRLLVQTAAVLGDVTAVVWCRRAVSELLNESVFKAQSHQASYLLTLREKNPNRLLVCARFNSTLLMFVYPSAFQLHLSLSRTESDAVQEVITTKRRRRGFFVFFESLKSNIISFKAL